MTTTLSRMFVAAGIGLAAFGPTARAQNCGGYASYAPTYYAPTYYAPAPVAYSYSPAYPGDAYAAPIVYPVVYTSVSYGYRPVVYPSVSYGYRPVYHPPVVYRSFAPAPNRGHVPFSFSGHRGGSRPTHGRH